MTEKSTGQPDEESPRWHDSKLPRMLFVKDLARMTGRTEGAVRKAVHAKVFGGYSYFRGRLMVRTESFLAHLKANETSPKPPKRTPPPPSSDKQPGKNAPKKKPDQTRRKKKKPKETDSNEE